MQDLAEVLVAAVLLLVMMIHPAVAAHLVVAAHRLVAMTHPAVAVHLEEAARPEAAVPQAMAGLLPAHHPDLMMY